VDFSTFLSPADAERAHGTLRLLRAHRIEPLVLTGGLAVELHMLRFGLPAETRALNDMDFLVDSFDDIPTTLAAELLFRHVHPHDPPGKTLLQCVDPETAVRVDIFRAFAGIVARARQVELCGAAMRIISVEDLTAHTGRLCMDLAANEKTPAKHAQDFLWLLPPVDLEAMRPIWKEHRKPDHPESFAAVAALLTDLIATKSDLQIIRV
jgi:hypothetical protein